MFFTDADRSVNALTQSFQIFSIFAMVDPTQPTKNWKISTQPDPWVNPTQASKRLGLRDGQLWFMLVHLARTL